jgi:hypothetical protein
MYKLNMSRFIQFSLYNMFWPFSPSSGKLYYISALLSCYYSPTLASVYSFLRGKVISDIYSVNTGCNSYASLDIRLKLIVIKLEQNNKMNR